MNDIIINKLENPERMAELDSKNTLIKSGFKDGMTLCDIGAGTGIFSFAAGEISNNDIYALEISDDLVELLNSRIVEKNIKNLKVMKVHSDILPLEDGVCDIVIMATVLHEIEKKMFMLNEIKRILKEKGKLVVIEFHKKTTPIGPPVDRRISEEYVEKLCNSNGFKIIDKFVLGENFYCMIFE